MAWIEQIAKRTQTARTWRDSENPRKHQFVRVLKTPLHYPTAGPDSDEYDGVVDMTPVRIDNPQLDGWRIVNAGWHCALGKPGDKPTDGWVGFGGRQGQNWIKFRLAKAGYLHWPTRAWQDIGGAPTYNRANLFQQIGTIIVGPNNEEIKAASSAAWEGIWTTPGGGKLDVRWHLDGLREKQEIYINQEAREWITANRPPSTPPADTYFGFVFQLDVSDIPKWVKNGIKQDIDGDFDDSDTSRVELRDALDRLLAFTPTSVVFSDEYGEDGERDQVRLRKRFWKDNDGNHYLLLGVKVTELDNLHEGGITFDPPWSVQPDADAGKDNYLTIANTTFNAGTQVKIACDAGERHGVIEFDCSGIPGGSTCDSAVLSLWSEDIRDTLSFDIYSLHANVHDWTEGGSCWDNYKALTAWPGSGGASTPGTDYEADASPPSIAYPASAADTEAQADLTSGNNLTAARIAGWFGAGNTNYGLLIGVTGATSVRDWHSSDATTAGYRPKLTIEYTEAAAGQPMRHRIGRGTIMASPMRGIY